MTDYEVQVLRATRLELNGTTGKTGSLRLERIEIMEIRWPNGETDVMEHAFRVPGSFDPDSDPVETADFWLRHTYQDYDTAVSEQRRIELEDGTLVGEPVEFVGLGAEVTIPWTYHTPEEWGRGSRD